MSQGEPAVVEGLEAVYYLVRHAVPQLIDIWSGDETAVALIRDVRDSQDAFAVSWGTRHDIVDGLQRKSEVEQQPSLRQKLLVAATTLIAPPNSGQISCVILGWGDVIAFELDAEELRMGRMFTTWATGQA